MASKDKGTEFIKNFRVGRPRYNASTYWNEDTYRLPSLGVKNREVILELAKKTHASSGDTSALKEVPNEFRFLIDTLEPDSYQEMDLSLDFWLSKPKLYGYEQNLNKDRKKTGQPALYKRSEVLLTLMPTIPDTWIWDTEFSSHASWYISWLENNNRLGILHQGLDVYKPYTVSFYRKSYTCLPKSSAMLAWESFCPFEFMLIPDYAGVKGLLYVYKVNPGISAAGMYYSNKDKMPCRDTGPQGWHVRSTIANCRRSYHSGDNPYNMTCTSDKKIQMDYLRQLHNKKLINIMSDMFFLKFKGEGDRYPTYVHVTNFDFMNGLLVGMSYSPKMGKVQYHSPNLNRTGVQYMPYIRTLLNQTKYHKFGTEYDTSQPYGLCLDTSLGDTAYQESLEEEEFALRVFKNGRTWPARIF